MASFCLCGYSGGRWTRLAPSSCTMRTRPSLGSSCAIFSTSRASTSTWRRSWTSWSSYTRTARSAPASTRPGLLRTYVTLPIVPYGRTFVFWNIFFMGFVVYTGYCERNLKWIDIYYASSFLQKWTSGMLLTWAHFRVNLSFIYTLFYGLGGRGNAKNAGQEKHRKNHSGSYFGTKAQTCE